jgi:PHD/YefM family antitoxin component YafN of YafNO toxin-antitoxin module
MKFKNELNEFFNRLNESKEVKQSEEVNEATTRTAMEIGGLTGMNKDAVQKFVDTHNLDIEKVFQFVKKGKLSDRMDFVTAVVGKPDNPIQKKIIKMIGESVIKQNESEEVNEAISKARLQSYDDLLHNGEDLLVIDKKGTTYIYNGSADEYNAVAVMDTLNKLGGRNAETTYQILDLKNVKDIKKGNIYTGKVDENENIFLKLESAIGDVLKNLNENENNSTEKQELLEQLSIMNRKLNDFHNSLID